MTLTDYDSVMALWQHTENMGFSKADSKENIAYFLQRNPDLCFCAWKEDKLVGAVLCGHDGRRGAIYHLAVDQGYRGNGIGQQLVEHCLYGLQQAGIERCHIHVYAENKLGLAFWKKNGWFLRPELALLSKDIR
ncbi:MAG: GNAT family N-acetyltransferase [Anaerolineaceae bacterium]|nr:GNAT family N-acetyltransferase [Anaerolineaceae bacterium]